MTSEEIPAELKDMLDRAAGRVHSASGPVMTCLAQILTRHEEMVRERLSVLRQITPEEEAKDAEAWI